MAAEEVAVEQSLHVIRDVVLERLEPRPGLRLRLRRLPRGFGRRCLCTAGRAIIALTVGFLKYICHIQDSFVGIRWSYPYLESGSYKQ